MVVVGDAGVEHGDGHAASARVPIGDQVAPGLHRTDTPLPGEVPLELLPAARGAGAARIVRVEGRAERPEQLVADWSQGIEGELLLYGERGRCPSRVRDVIRYRPEDVAPTAEAGERRRHADPAA
jgi:hypothetical protein